MRKILLVACILTLNLSSVLAHSGHGGHEVENDDDFVTLRTVKGTVTLLAKGKNFPSTMSSLYKGRSNSVTTSPEGKVIKVNGTYDGTDTVSVHESGVSLNATYSFTVPVIRSVIESITTTKGQAITGSITALFSGEKDVNSAGSIITQFIYTSRDLSIIKLTAQRTAKKAIVKASFAKRGTAAKGRFKLVFTE